MTDLFGGGAWLAEGPATFLCFILTGRVAGHVVLISRHWLVLKQLVQQNPLNKQQQVEFIFFLKNAKCAYVLS